jgi:hypothetical protein
MLDHQTRRAPPAKMTPSARSITGSGYDLLAAGLELKFAPVPAAMFRSMANALDDVEGALTTYSYVVDYRLIRDAFSFREPIRNVERNDAGQIATALIAHRCEIFPDRRRDNDRNVLAGRHSISPSATQAPGSNRVES